VAIRHHILLPASYQPPLIFTHSPDTTMASGMVVASAFVQNTLGYSFTDTRLLEEALETTGLRSPGSNGRLAMIGDSRLKDVILDEWYASGASKGTGQQLVSTIGSNQNLARIARQIGLDRGHISLHPGHMGPPTDGTLATTIEAVLGAIYWDSRDERNVRNAMIQMGLTAGSQPGVI